MPIERAKLVDDGEGQVVVLPEAFWFDCDDVDVRREGDKVILTPSRTPLPRGKNDAPRKSAKDR